MSETALADVKVLDLMWSIAGPAATRTLADYGATVVRVESSRRIDTARTLRPFHQGKAGVENSGVFQDFNAGKLGITLDLSGEVGRGVLLDLVRWADVVLESFSPGVMRAWGLDYEALRKVKPDIVMLSSTLMGQDGPLAGYAGYGTGAAALAGFFSLTGWPDRAPTGPFGAYTDYVVPKFTAAAILAALDYRRRTGKGQYVDFSQLEATLHFLAPAILEYTVNGRDSERMGNRDPVQAPHGLYPTAGEDQWVAIAISSEEQWQTLCRVMQCLELVRDERFATREARLAHHDELDELIAEWTRAREAEEIESTLQSMGVAAGRVRTVHELATDPQLLDREHFVELEHPFHGTTTVEGSRFKLSRTPARIATAGPTLGRDTPYVLTSILGYDAERIEELAAAGAFR